MLAHDLLCMFDDGCSSDKTSNILAKVWVEYVREQYTLLIVGERSTVDSLCSGRTQSHNAVRP